MKGPAETRTISLQSPTHGSDFLPHPKATIASAMKTVNCMGPAPRKRIAEFAGDSNRFLVQDDRRDLRVGSWFSLDCTACHKDLGGANEVAQSLSGRSVNWSAIRAISSRASRCASRLLVASMNVWVTA